MANANPVRLLSQGNVLAQVSQWRAELPTIQPYYAVKSNPDARLIGWLRGAGVKFDCASVREMDTVIGAGAGTDEILYANPLKSGDELIMAMERNVDVGGGVGTVVDCEEEVEKLADVGWRGGVLVRLAVDDTESKSPFSIKFGAERPSWTGIMRRLGQRGLRFAGVSFHIGSASQNPVQFTRAIESARDFQWLTGVSIPVMDIGGGFLPDAKNFVAAAGAIQAARADWMAAGNCPPTWIAEPGRFFSAYSTGLVVPIIAKKRGPGGVGWRYVLAESVYGQFSCIPFDHGTPYWELVGGDAGRMTKDEPAYFFGRTCDSLDLIAYAMRGVEYEVGDMMWFPAMGAYTNASASEFNGFAVPEAVYLDETLPVQVEAVDEAVMFPIQTVSELRLSAFKT